MAGAGLWLLALAVTAGHFLVVFAFTPLAARLPRSKYAPSRIRLTYLDGRGVLRRALTECTDRGFTVGELTVDQHDEDDDSRTVTVWLTVQGAGEVSDLVATLTEIPGVRVAAGDDANSPTP